MPGNLSFSIISPGRNIKVTRDPEVSDDFWLRLRAEWGQHGRNPNKSVVVPVEQFSQRQAWLPEACRRFGVRVSLDESVRLLVSRGRSDREALSSILNRAAEFNSRLILERLMSTRFVRELKEFQIRDASKIIGLSHGANFSVPGAGKTTVEFAVYESERARGRVQQMLVVAPLSAFSAWSADSTECLSPEPRMHRFDGRPIPTGVEITLVNYQRLASGFELLADWVSRKPTLMVLDEAHRMKRGRDGEWGTACLDLAFLCTRRDVLTGTPAPQHPSDLVAILNFLWPGQAERILPGAALLAHPLQEDVEQVSTSIGPLFSRTTKGELELPEPIRKVIRVPLVGLQREIYNSLLANFSAQITSQKERVSFQRLGEITMYLLEAATNPALLPAGSSSSDLIEFRHPPLEIPKGSTLFGLLVSYSRYETPPKFVQLASIVRGIIAEGRKVLIWSSFVRNIETLKVMLATYQPAVAYGDVPSASSSSYDGMSRETELDRFRNDPNCKVLLANPAAIGEGISLHHECHDAIYLDRTFNAGQFLQSVDRIHRLGLEQDSVTNIVFLLTENTIDEVVLDRVNLKAANLGRMLDDPHIASMTLPDEDDEGPPIDPGDAGDIESLFRHLRGGDSS